MNKFLDFIERLVKTFILASFFTLLFSFVIFFIFFLFDVKIGANATYYFISVVFVCMSIVSYELLKELEND